MSGQKESLTEKNSSESQKLGARFVFVKEVGDKLDGVVDETVLIEQQKVDNEKKHRLSDTSPTYYCRCGNPIPKERREALPGVKICVTCANAQQTQH